jgi:hypothetical protein
MSFAIRSNKMLHATQFSCELHDAVYGKAHHLLVVF